MVSIKRILKISIYSLCILIIWELGVNYLPKENVALHLETKANSSDFSMKKEYEKYLKNRDSFYEKVLVFDENKSSKRLKKLVEKALDIIVNADRDLEVIMAKDLKIMDEKIYLVKTNYTLDEINSILDKK